ncbi:pirin family protein [Emcibacter sp.]|uniref:pirin family protein n=1 Tax=Emcibacter sp. TaxID=1979954 RepID=UPI003A94A82D
MAVAHILTPKKTDLGEFSVRRIIPHVRQRMVGPWIFFDHMGPAEFAPGEGVNVRPHPHINLATVTYLFEGEILHRDSLGSEQVITPGAVNLMVAGKGIVHSEREREEVHTVHHRAHGLQLWHALPEEEEEREPSFHHYPDADIPAFDVEGVPVRVMMGQAWGRGSPVITFAETLYVEARLSEGQSLPVPEADELAIYVVSGRVQIGQQDVEQYHMAVLEDFAGETIQALGDSQIAIIGGEKMGKRFLDWNFASSRRERIEQARADWKQGRFPKVPGDDKEFIPLPE